MQLLNEVIVLHQAEEFVKQIVGEIGRPSYMQEFLKQGKDKKAIEDVAKKLKQFSENMSVLQPIAIKGFMVPSGSLMLFRYLLEELEVMEKMVQEDEAWEEERKAKANRNPGDTSSRHREPDAMTVAQKEEMRTRVGIVRHRLLEMMESLLSQPSILPTRSSSARMKRRRRRRFSKTGICRCTWTKKPWASYTTR